MFPTVMNSQSVGMFSCERIATLFLTFVPHGEKTVAEKKSPSSRTTKISFIRRSANFGNVSPFSSRGNKHIFRAYPSTLKIAELCFETTAAHCTIIWSARLGFLPLRLRNRLCRRTATFTHFWSSSKHYIAHGNNAHETSLELLDTAFTIRFEAKCKQWHALFSCEINHRVYQIYKEGRDVNRFLTARPRFWIPWSERTNCMENGQLFVFFLPHTPRGRVRLARETLTLLLLYSKPILRKKSDCFAVYLRRYFIKKLKHSIRFDHVTDDVIFWSWKKLSGRTFLSRKFSLPCDERLTLYSPRPSLPTFKLMRHCPPKF